MVEKLICQLTLNIFETLFWKCIQYNIKILRTFVIKKVLGSISQLQVLKRRFIPEICKVNNDSI